MDKLYAGACDATVQAGAIERRRCAVKRQSRRAEILARFSLKVCRSSPASKSGGAVVASGALGRDANAARGSKSNT